MTSPALLHLKSLFLCVLLLLNFFIRIILKMADNQSEKASENFQRPFPNHLLIVTILLGL